MQLQYLKVTGKVQL